MNIAPGSVDQSLTVQIVDDNGAPVTDLLAADWPGVFYARVREAEVSITLSDLSAITAAYASGGVAEIGGGYYRLDGPNTAWATASAIILIIGEASDMHLLCPAIECASDATIYGETGAIDHTITIRNSTNTAPLEGVAVYVSSDSAGVNRSQIKITDSLGRVTFHLDAGPVYVWPQPQSSFSGAPYLETVS